MARERARTGSDRSRSTRRELLRSAGAAAALIGSGVLGVGLSGGAARAQDLRLVAATTGMVADVARNLLGDAAGPSGGFRVTALMGSGVDPHSYRETRADIEILLRAEAVFWNGLYLEAQLEELLLALGEEKPVFAIAEAVPRERLRAHDDYAGRYDPHVWMEPTLWAHAVDAAEAALAGRAPDLADMLAANAAAYRAELEALDAYSREILASVPEESRVLVTAHDAFGYFGAAYGFEVVGVQGVSTESEAGLARIREIVRLIVERGVKAVFVESSVSPRNVQALIEGARAEGAEVSLGAELFSDAMGADGTYEGTYLGMIDHNVTAIARALGGAAPARGRLGQLRADA